MPARIYGQYCGLARALELIGERWALLVVRDLLVGPKRFTDLRTGLPRIPTNVLAARLRELETAGIIQRRVLPRPAASIVYELTPYGRELEKPLLDLGLWGARSLGTPRAEDVLTVDALILALRATFQHEKSRGVTMSVELHVGDVLVHAQIQDGKLDTASGPLQSADLVLHAGPELKALMTGEITPADAVKNRDVRIRGRRELLSRFVELFHLDPAPMIHQSVDR